MGNKILQCGSLYTHERGITMSKKDENRRYYEMNQEFIKATKRVAYDIKVGKIQPEPCVVCGSEHTKPWHWEKSDPNHYEWYCKACKAREQAEIEAEINAIDAKHRELDLHRSFSRSLRNSKVRTSHNEDDDE